MSRARLIGVGAAVAMSAVLTGCGPGEPQQLPRLHGVEQYRPGLDAHVFLPATRHPAPVVVLVPGGAWRTADETGMRPLADTLAAAGSVAVTITYRAADAGAHFPVPVQDVACAASWAAARARRAGITPTALVLLGHSAGAQLAALAALAPERWRGGSCPARPVAPTGLIGLAGPYEITGFPQASDLFTPDASDAAWRAADPRTWVRDHPALPVLLVHGTADTDVSPTFSETFAEQLRQAGHPVRLVMIPHAGHADVYRADVVAAIVQRWLRAHRATSVGS